MTTFYVSQIKDSADKQKVVADKCTFNHDTQEYLFERDGKIIGIFPRERVHNITIEGIVPKPTNGPTEFK